MYDSYFLLIKVLCGVECCREDVFCVECFLEDTRQYLLYSELQKLELVKTQHLVRPYTISIESVAVKTFLIRNVAWEGPNSAFQFLFQ